MPELDRFEEEGIDDNAELSDLSMSERMAAEREMRKRDREEMAATGRMRPGLLYGQNSSMLLAVVSDSLFSIIVTLLIITPFRYLHLTCVSTGLFYTTSYGNI